MSSVVISASKLNKYFNALTVFSCVINKHGFVEYVNESAYQATYLAVDLFIGRHVVETYWWSHDTKVQVFLETDIAHCLNKNKQVKRKTKYRVAKGKIIWVLCILTPIKSIHDEIESILIETQDITLFIEQEERIIKLKEAAEASSKKYQALMNIDPLTNVYNRRGFKDIIAPIYSLALRKQKVCSLFMLDIDDFKAVNDQYGHLKGDKVITFISAMLREEVRSEDVICRWGGEEFLIFSSETSEKATYSFAERIRKKIFSSSNQCLNLRVTVSIGIYYGGVSDSLDTIISYADEAMYKAKKQGKNCIYVSHVS
jgi:diguanylate cyclase (GGDEF)-like protein/PAS domain S-box-containing protein